jgi:hypothetical protein
MGEFLLKEGVAAVGILEAQLELLKSALFIEAKSKLLPLLQCFDLTLKGTLRK